MKGIASLGTLPKLGFLIDNISYKCYFKVLIINLQFINLQFFQCFSELSYFIKHIVGVGRYFVRKKKLNEEKNYRGKFKKSSKTGQYWKTVISALG